MTTDTQLTPTDAEIDALWRFEARKNWDSTLAVRTSFARAVLARWGQPARSGEPVATVIKRGASRDWMSERLGGLPDGVYSLYLAPQPSPAPHGQAPAGGRVYAFRRKGLADFCTCDEARYEELSNKPHLFETRIFYTAPQPMEREPLTDEQIHAIYDEVARREPYAGAVTRRSIVRAIEAAHGIKGG